MQILFAFPPQKLLPKIIWDKVFKSGLSKFFKDCLPQNLFSPFLNSFSHIPLQVEEVVLDDTEQCQQNTDFIKKLLDAIINNALGKLEKLSDTTKITTCHKDEM